MLDPQGCFQRFRADDPVALAAKVAAAGAQLADVRAAADAPALLVLLNQVGASLTVLGREAEALPFLTEALALAQTLGEQEKEVQILNNLATTLQYLGQREQALALFAEALAKAPDSPAWAQRDFILHHRGRCLVELGKIEEARDCFEQALAVRLAKDDPHYIASTRRALAALG
jgi:tetratricopeptide (TPR) repeat protein